MKTLLKRNLFLSCLAVLLCFGIAASSYGQAVVAVDPAESPSPPVGSQLTIDLKITNAQNVAAYEVNVHFDPSALEYKSSANGSYLPSGAFFAPPQVADGKVTLVATSISDAASATSGTLASVTFAVVAVKASTLQLSDVLLSDIDAKPLSVTTRDGSVVEQRGLKWDVNSDGTVNVLDLVRVAKSLGTTDARMDINGDGTVNVLDLTLVARNLGATRGDEPPVREDPPPAATDDGDDPDPYEGMVLIEAGEFRMGSNSGSAAEKPVHSVYVDAFYMDEYEVTNAQYAAFLNAKGKHAEAGHTWLDIGDDRCLIEYISRTYRPKAGYENHPVIYVSWYGAMAYAAWAGKRLPTEAEWEKAARGGLSGLKYPWGNAIDSTKANYNRHIDDTTAVGKYPANGYGLYDMAGNAHEWCLDEWNVNFYSISPAQNPLSGANSIQWLLDNYTGVKSHRVIRGGAWYVDADRVRCAYRNATTPRPRIGSMGFRCVKAVTP